MSTLPSYTEVKRKKKEWEIIEDFFGQHMYCFNIKNMRRIIEPLSGYHVWSDIRCKTIKFYKRLKLSPRPAVQCLLGICSKDKSSITGRNIDALMNITTESDFTSVKRSITISLRPGLN